VFLVSFLNPAHGVFTSDLRFLDDAIYHPPQIQNPALNKKVNFSFKDTKLSYILLLLSKVGEFNVVLPEQYDRNISITLSQERVIDSIEDICKLTGLTYEFKSNSLVIAKPTVQGLSFISVPIVHNSAETIVENLNNVLFRQLMEVQNENFSKPHAAIDSSKNSVIVVAHPEQLALAKNFIIELDSPPQVRIFTPSYLGFLDARKLIGMHFSDNSSFKLKRFEQNSFLLKGTSDEVKKALEILKAYDTPPKIVNLTIKLYGILVDQSSEFVKKNNLLDYIKLQKIDRASFLDKNKFVINYLTLLDQQEIQLNRNQEHDYNDIKIKARSNMIETDKIMLTAFDDTLAALDMKTDIACKFLGPDQLKIYKKLTRFTKRDYSLLVICFE
jgi:hypothetical protein